MMERGRRAEDGKGEEDEMRSGMEETDKTLTGEISLSATQGYTTLHFLCGDRVCPYFER